MEECIQLSEETSTYLPLHFFPLSVSVESKDMSHHGYFCIHYQTQKYPYMVGVTEDHA